MSKPYFDEGEIYDYVKAAAEEFIANFLSSRISKDVELYIDIMGTTIGSSKIKFTINVVVPHYVHHIDFYIDFNTAIIEYIPENYDGYSSLEEVYTCRKTGNIEAYYGIDVKFDDEDTFKL